MPAGAWGTPGEDGYIPLTVRSLNAVLKRELEDLLRNAAKLHAKAKTSSCPGEYWPKRDASFGGTSRTFIGMSSLNGAKKEYKTPSFKGGVKDIHKDYLAIHRQFMSILQRVEEDVCTGMVNEKVCTADEFSFYNRLSQSRVPGAFQMCKAALYEGEGDEIQAHMDALKNVPDAHFVIVLSFAVTPSAAGDFTMIKLNWER